MVNVDAIVACSGSVAEADWFDLKVGGCLALMLHS